MHDIGNVADGNCVLRLARIQPGPHRSGDLAVQSRNGVGAPRELERQNGHAEFLLRIAWILATERHEAFMG